MKRLRISLVVVALVSVFACGPAGTPATKTPEAGPTLIPEAEPTLTPEAEPTLTPEAELTLVGYGYYYRDVGDGWYEGTVGLAFENRTDRPVDFDGALLPPPVIETEEGQTYEGTVGYFDMIFKEDNSIKRIPLIPPGFRVKAKTSYGRYLAFVQFRSAAAAHPTFITFPGTEFTIDLYDAYQTESFGFVGADSSSIKPITELYDRVLVDDPNGAKVTVKGCNIRTALIVVSATSSNGTRINADKETRISVNLRESASKS